MAPHQRAPLDAARRGGVAATSTGCCLRLRPHALDLVDAFGYEPEHVRAPIASGAEQERQDEARAHYAALRAAGTLPTPEKHIKK